MPQAKKKAAKQAAAKKTAAKRPAAVTPQVNRSRMTTQTKNDSPPREETQAELDAAGDARRDRAMTPGQTGKEPDQVYEPKHQALEATGLDQDSAEAKRQAELAAQRDEHNRRTGDASRGIAAQVGST